MSIPLGEQDVAGNLVTSAAADLNVPVGTVIGTGSTVASANITTPVATTNILLFQTNATGTVTVKLDTAAAGATPSFASGRVVTVAPADNKLYALVIDTSLAFPVVAVQIANTSGASVTVQKLALAVLGLNTTVGSNDGSMKLDWHSTRSALNMFTNLANPNGRSIATFTLTQ